MDVSGSALDHDVCLMSPTPTSITHTRPAARQSAAHPFFPLFKHISPLFHPFFIRNVNCDMEANTRALRAGEISPAGFTATLRTCVTLRKYLLEELRGVTASANITSDHK